MVGSGILNDPYLITNASDWADINTYQGTRVYFKLVNDIDFNNQLITPLKNFMGYIDGNYKRIKYFKVNNDTVNTGIFDTINGDMVTHSIKDLEIYSGSLEYSFGIENFGFVAGIINSASISNVHVVQCKDFNGSISISTDFNFGFFAGKTIDSNIISSSVRNSEFDLSDINSYSGSDSFGGFVGKIDDSTINTCYSDNRFYNITTQAIDNLNIGGFVGHVTGSHAEILNCHTSASLDITSYNSIISKIGGFVGNVQECELFENCYSNTWITTDATPISYINGFVGYSADDNYNNCFYNYDRVPSGFNTSYVEISGRSDKQSNSIVRLPDSEMKLLENYTEIDNYYLTFNGTDTLYFDANRSVLTYPYFDINVNPEWTTLSGAVVLNDTEDGNQNTYNAKITGNQAGMISTGLSGIIANTPYIAKIRYKSNVKFRIMDGNDYLYKEFSQSGDWTYQEFKFTTSTTLSNTIKILTLTDGTLWIDSLYITRDINVNFNSVELIDDKVYNKVIELDGYNKYIYKNYPLNLLNSGSFESGTNVDNWHTSGTVVFNSTEIGKTGNYCCKIENIYGNASISKSTWLTVGKKYKLTFRYKSTSNVNIGYLQDPVAYGTLSPTSQWNTIIRTFTALSTYFGISISNGTLFIDDISISEDTRLDVNESYDFIKHSMNRDFEIQFSGSELMTNTGYDGTTDWINTGSNGLAAGITGSINYALDLNGNNEYLYIISPQNLLSDGGFTNGTNADSWNTTGTVLFNDTEIGKSGNYCVKIVSSGTQGLYKTGFVTVGKKYKLSIRYKGTTTLNIGRTDNIIAYGTVSATSQWNTVIRTFVANTDTSLFLYTGTSGTIWLDDIDIREDWKLDLNESYDLIKHSFNRTFEQTLGNDLITNGANWTDSNSDGLANDWASSGYADAPNILTEMLSSGGWTTFTTNALDVTSAIATSAVSIYFRTGKTVDMYLTAGTYRITFTANITSAMTNMYWRLASQSDLNGGILDTQTYNTSGTYTYTVVVPSDGTYFWGLRCNTGTVNLSISNASIRLDSGGSGEVYSIVSGSGWSGSAQRVYNSSGLASIKHTGSLYYSGSKYFISGQYKSTGSLRIYKNATEYYAEFPANNSNIPKSFNADVLLTENIWYFGVSGSSANWFEIDNITAYQIPSLIVSGTIDAGTGWTAGTGCIFTDGVARINNVTVGDITNFCYQNLGGYAVSKRLKLSFEIKNYSVGSLKINAGGNIISISNSNSNGIRSIEFTQGSDSNGYFGFYLGAGESFVGDIDNVHIYELPNWIYNGNHVYVLDKSDKYAGTGSLLISASGVGNSSSNYINLPYTEIQTISQYKKYILEFSAKPVSASLNVIVGMGANSKSFALANTASWTSCVWNIDNYNNSFTNQDIKVWLNNSGSVNIDDIKFRQNYDLAMITSGKFQRNVTYSGSWDLLIFGSETSISSSAGYGLSYDNYDGLWGDFADNKGNILSVSSSIMRDYYYDSIILTKQSNFDSNTSSLYISSSLINVSCGTLGIIDVSYDETSSMNPVQGFKGWLGRTELIRFDNMSASNFNPTTYRIGNGITGGGAEIVSHYNWRGNTDSDMLIDKSFGGNNLSSSNITLSDDRISSSASFGISSGSGFSGNAQYFAGSFGEGIMLNNIISGSKYAISFQYRSNSPLAIYTGNIIQNGAEFSIPANINSASNWSGEFLSIHNRENFIGITSSSGWIEIDQLRVRNIPNLISNGTFDDTSYWSITQPSTISINTYLRKCSFLNSSAGQGIYKDNILIVGNRYKISLQVTDYVSGSISPYYGVYPSVKANNNGIFTWEFVAQNTSLYIYTENGFTGYIDNVHIYEIPDYKDNGNHVANITLLDKYTGSSSLLISASGIGDSSFNYISLPYTKIDQISQYKKYILEFVARPSTSGLNLTIGIGANSKSFALTETSSWTSCIWNIDNYDNSFTNQDVKMWLNNSGSIWFDNLRLKQNYDLALVTAGKFSINTAYSGSWDLLIFGSETTDSSSVGYGLSYDNGYGIWGDFVDNNSNILTVSSSVIPDKYYDSIILVKDSYRDMNTSSLYIENQLINRNYGTLGLMDIPYEESGSINPSQGFKGWLGRTQIIRFDNISVSNFNPTTYRIGDIITGGGAEVVANYTWKDAVSESTYSATSDQLFYDKSSIRNDLSVYNINVSNIKSVPFNLITGSLVISRSSFNEQLITGNGYTLEFKTYASGNNAIPMDVTASIGTTTYAWTGISYNSASPSKLSYNFVATSSNINSDMIFQKSTPGVLNIYDISLAQTYDTTINVMLENNYDVVGRYLMYMEYDSGSFYIRKDVNEYTFSLGDVTFAVPSSSFGTGSWASVSYVHKVGSGTEVFVNGNSVLYDSSSKYLSSLKSVEYFVVGNDNVTASYASAYSGKIGEIQMIRGYAYNSEDSLYLYENGFNYPRVGNIAFWYKWIEGSTEDIAGYNELTAYDTYNTDFGSYESVNNVRLRELFSQNYGIYYDYNDGYPYLYGNEYKFYTRNDVESYDGTSVIKVGRIFKIKWNSYY